MLRGRPAALARQGPGPGALVRTRAPVIAEWVSVAAWRRRRAGGNSGGCGRSVAAGGWGLRCPGDVGAAPCPCEDRCPWEIGGPGVAARVTAAADSGSRLGESAGRRL